MDRDQLAYAKARAADAAQTIGAMSMMETPMTADEQKEADAATLAAKKQVEATAALAKQLVVIIGGPGPFSINGPGLGTKGRLVIGGHEINTTRWDDRSVRGLIPDGLQGEVVLTTSDGLVRKGVYER